MECTSEQQVAASLLSVSKRFCTQMTPDIKHASSQMRVRAGEQQEVVYHAPFVLPWMPEQPADSAEPITLTARESRHNSAPLSHAHALLQQGMQAMQLKS